MLRQLRRIPQRAIVVAGIGCGRSPAIAARGRGPSPSTPERLARLTRGIGRAVVVSSPPRCVGARWHDGTIPGLMAEWSPRPARGPDTGDPGVVLGAHRAR